MLHHPEIILRLGGCKILAASTCTDDLHQLFFRVCYKLVMIRSNLVYIFIVVLGLYVVYIV